MYFRFPAKSIALLSRVIIMVTNCMQFVLFPEFSKVSIFPASIQDIHFLQDIKHQMNNGILIGDRGYLSTQVQTDLFNYAKSFNGFKTRILSKITTLTFIQFVNIFLFNRKMNNIKIALV